MGQALEIAKVLVSPTIKLMDMVGSAIGTAYEPRHKRKMAEATAHEINVIGEAMRNAADMPIVYNQDGVVMNSEDFNRLMQRAGTRLILQETIKQHNIESVIDNAYEILDKKDFCSEEPVDQDWINSFFDSVANVSNEQMQIVWGRILAGEIENPGSYSIRTLDTLKKMTQAEAELFKSLFPYVLRCWGDKQKTYYDYFVPSEMLPQINMSYPNIFLLNEANLISSNSFITVSFMVAPGKTENIWCLNSKIEFTNISDEEIKISGYAFVLTEVGKTLYNTLCDETHTIVDMEYLRACGKILSKQDSIFESKDFVDKLMVNIVE